MKLLFKPTFLISANNSNVSEGSSAIAVDSSYSEGVHSSWSESSTSERLPCHIFSGCSLTLFLELHSIPSDDPITLNAGNSIPGHCDASGGHGGNQGLGYSSGGYIVEKITHMQSEQLLY